MASSEKAEDSLDTNRKPPQQRLPYEKPRIVDRGRLVEVALGGSPGTGDSGGGALVENPLV